MIKRFFTEEQYDALNKALVNFDFMIFEVLDVIIFSVEKVIFLARDIIIFGICKCYNF